MSAPRKYPNELRERAVRLVAEAREQESELSLNAAVHRIGPRGVNVDTLRGWCKQVEVDAGRRRGVTTGEAARGQGAGAGGSGAEAGERGLVGGVEFLRAGA